jgi:hypothetical protein
MTFPPIARLENPDNYTVVTGFSIIAPAEAVKVIESFRDSR